ncbi:MAG: pantetheine-phosphate adenylyltransferase [Eubacterium sp.]|nr:pantetheine-phosphate adenylyltransferase [Eubacterium sp.]
MRNAIYPGSFDPPTYGHLDVIKRASTLFDKVIVSVLNNSAKTPLFSAEERVNMLREAVCDLPNVEVRSFEGLTIEFAKECNACAIVRGLRAVTDFEYELQLAQVNKVMAPAIETVLLTTALEYAFLSSTVVREFASYGSDISKFVPPSIEKCIIKRLNELKNKNN